MGVKVGVSVNVDVGLEMTGEGETSAAGEHEANVRPVSKKAYKTWEIPLKLFMECSSGVVWMYGMELGSDNRVGCA